MLLSRCSGSKAGQAVGANIATHATCDGMLLTMKDHLMCNKLISSAEASRAFRAILPYEPTLPTSLHTPLLIAILF